MTPPVLTFFNNTGGVGKTSLLYHLAWMWARLGQRIVIIDLDPQANLTAAFLEEEKIEAIWSQQGIGSTIHQCVRPLADVGDIAEPMLVSLAPNLHLLPGDVGLSGFEETLSAEWPNSLRGTTLYRPMRILSSFWQVMQMAARQVETDIILVDIGPNLGAINRSVLVATDYVVIPLGADLFSLQGLKNLGPTLRSWKHLWHKRLENWNESLEKGNYPQFKLPEGKMQPIGYLCQQQGVRLERPIKAYDQWLQRIPEVYRKDVLNEPATEKVRMEEDPYCLGTVRHYRSLIPMAQERRKPIFDLTSADGAIGSHASAVQDAKRDFRQLAEKIGDQIGLQQ